MSHKKVGLFVMPWSKFDQVVMFDVLARPYAPIGLDRSSCGEVIQVLRVNWLRLNFGGVRGQFLNFGHSLNDLINIDLSQKDVTLV